MAGTINNAGSDTNPNSASKIGFWDSTFNALRQMKFSELVTWLGTYFGAPTGTTLNGDIAGFRDSFGKNLVDLGSPLAVLNSAVSPAISGNVLTADGSKWTSATPTGGGGGGGGGNWTSDSNTWTFSSADSPTFVISVNADMTALITAGLKSNLLNPLLSNISSSRLLELIPVEQLLLQFMAEQTIHWQILQSHLQITVMPKHPLDFHYLLPNGQLRFRIAGIPYTIVTYGKHLV